MGFFDLKKQIHGVKTLCNRKFEKLI